MRWARMLGAARRRGRRAVVHVDVCKCTYHRMHYSYWRLPARDARLHHTQWLTNGPSATTNCIKCARDNYSAALMLHFIMDCSACRTATEDKKRKISSNKQHTQEMTMNVQRRFCQLTHISLNANRKIAWICVEKYQWKCIENIKYLRVFSS
jgi:hypothetical protein